MVNTNLYNTFFGIQQGGNIPKDLTKLLFEKRDLLVKTFANLIVQLGITYYVMEKTTIPKEKKTNYKIMQVFSIIYIFSFIIIVGFVPMPSWLKFILFCIFSYFSGYLLSIFKEIFGQEVIRNAILGSISIFAIMVALGLFMLLSGIKLGVKTGIFLFYCLLLLILGRIFNNFTADSSNVSKMLTIFGLFLFSIYIIYDTNIILQKNYNGDFITASIDYYLDIINIFIKLVIVNTEE